MSLRTDKSILTLGLLILVAGAASADHWPRFRGPNGNGVTADRDVPIQWGDRENLLWKTAIPGAGNSSPVVWGDHVFLQSAAANGKERMLFCLSARDGKIQWSRTAPGTTFKTLNKRNSYASSTPATDGERVYTIFWDGEGQTVHAYDIKGTPLWQHPLGSFKSQHGAGASPIVYDGKVYINNDQDGAAEVVCLDAKSGKPIWQVKRPPFRACYSVPFVLERPGEPAALIVGSTAGLTAYNPQDGSELWSYTWSFPGMALRTVGSPLYHNGIVFLAGGDGSGLRDMIAVKAGGKGDITARSLVWRSQDRAVLPYVPTILARGDHLYYVNDAGIAHCVEAKTGKVVWNERLSSPVSASPLMVDDRIYVVGENGDVTVFAADPSGYKQLAKNTLGEPSRSSPAVADNRLFIRGGTHLFGIARK
jgi:outer membrane protein assembly factor BamB